MKKYFIWFAWSAGALILTASLFARTSYAIEICPEFVFVAIVMCAGAAGAVMGIHYAIENAMASFALSLVAVSAIVSAVFMSLGILGTDLSGFLLALALAAAVCTVCYAGAWLECHADAYAINLEIEERRKD